MIAEKIFEIFVDKRAKKLLVVMRVGYLLRAGAKKRGYEFSLQLSNIR